MLCCLSSVMEGRGWRSREVKGAAESPRAGRARPQCSPLLRSQSPASDSFPPSTSPVTPPSLRFTPSPLLPSLCPPGALLPSLPGSALVAYDSRWAGTGPHAHRCERTFVPHSKPAVSRTQGPRRPACPGSHGQEGKGPRLEVAPSGFQAHPQVTQPPPPPAWAPNAPACVLQVTCAHERAWTREPEERLRGQEVFGSKILKAEVTLTFSVPESRSLHSSVRCGRLPT